MPFNPDEYLAKKSGGFNPDEYLAKKDKSWLRTEIPLVGGEVGENIVKPVMQAGGAIGGGSLGSLAGPMGTVAGAGTGYALANKLYKALDDKPIGTFGEELVETGKDIATGAAMEAGGPIAGKTLSGIAKSLPKVGTAVASSIYKVPKEATKRIVISPESVKQYVGKSPFEIGEEVLGHVVERDKQYVGKLNNELDKVIAGAGKENKLVDVNSVLNTLKKRASTIKGMTDEAIAQKKELLSRYQKLQEYLSENATKKVKSYLNVNKSKKLLPEEVASATKSLFGKISPEEAQILKRQLQDAASEKTSLGLVFNRTDAAGKAIKNASTKAKNAIEKVIPKVKGINKKLQENIQIKENSIVKNALKPEGIENTIKNLQSKTGNRGFLQKQIRKIDKNLGTNLEEITKDVYAAKYLESDKYLPSSIMGLATPVSIGAAAAGLPGAIIGGTLSSPAVYRGVAPRIGKLAPVQNFMEKIPETDVFKNTLKSYIYNKKRKKDEEE